MSAEEPNLLKNKEKEISRKRSLEAYCHLHKTNSSDDYKIVSKYINWSKEEFLTKFVILSSIIFFTD